MRQNLIVALLSICCTLLAVNLVISLRGPQLPQAFGQAVGAPSGQAVLATGMTNSGNEAVLYVYDVPTQALACYTTKGMGIELKGVRKITADLGVREFNAKGKSPSVKEMEDLLKKAGGGKDN